MGDTRDQILREAANQFRHYAQLHRAKGTPDGDEKASVNDEWAQRCIAVLVTPDADGSLINDRKFKIDSGRLVNRMSGEPIPEDEPIFIFRARDRHALPTLRFYWTVVSDPHHGEAIRDSIAAFEAFRNDNPTKMKEPGTTRHFALDQDSREPCGRCSSSGFITTEGASGLASMVPRLGVGSASIQERCPNCRGIGYVAKSAGSGSDRDEDAGR